MYGNCAYLRGFFLKKIKTCPKYKLSFFCLQIMGLIAPRRKEYNQVRIQTAGIKGDTDACR
jgi:hypothetical protein